MNEFLSMPRRILGATRNLLGVLWLAGLLTTLVSVVAPLMARRLINLFAANPHPPLAEVNTALALTVGALLASAVLAGLYNFVLVRMNEMATKALTLDVYRRLLRLSPLFFQGQEVERINNRALTDTGQVATFWLNAAAGIPLAVVSIAYYGWLMVRANPVLGILAMALSLFSGYFLLLDRRIQDVNRRWREVNDRIRVSTAEVIGGVEEIRQGGSYDHAMRNLEQRFEENRVIATEVAVLRGVFMGAGPLVTAIQNGTIQWLGAAAAAGVMLTRFGAMTWGDVMAFMGVLVLFQMPVRTIAGFIMDWRMAQESIRRLQEYLTQPEVFRSGPEAPALRPDAPIRFADVDLVVSGGTRILSGVSLDIPPGHHVAMAGPAGSGKSTAIQLLARNNDATRGQVTIGGRPLDAYDLDSMARGIGFVPQKAVLFNTSIRNNLLLGLRRPSGQGFEDAEGWIDTSSLPGVAGPEDLDGHLLEAVRVVGLEEDVFLKALDNPLPKGRVAALAGLIPALRLGARSRMREAGLALTPFSADACFPGSIGENLFGPGFGKDDLEPAVEVLLSGQVEAAISADLLKLGWHRYATESFLARRVGQRAPGLLQFLPTQQGGNAQTELMPASAGVDPAGLPRPMRALLLEFALETALEPADGAGGLGRMLVSARAEARGTGAARDRWEQVEANRFFESLSLRDNILGGRVEPGVRGTVERTEAMIRELLQDQNVHDPVLVAGLDAEVGEGGKRLSGGQRQKVAIARVILKNPGILLLDEATASLDELSQSRIVQLVRERFADRTVVSISHRLSTVRDSHQIVVLDRGRVVQQGSYAELVAISGVFRELASQQSEELPQVQPGPVPPETPGEGELVRRLSMVQLFASLDAQQLAFVARVARTVQAGTGTVLYQRGEPGRELFVILQGEVEFFAGDTVVTRYGAGRVFGEVAIFATGARTLGARAKTDTTLCVLDREDLYRLMEADHQLALGLLQGLAIRLAEVTEQRHPAADRP